ncbi:MAG: glycine cleavage system protein H [Pseudomonadota bacterium]
MLKFTDRHEWLKLDGEVAVVGITRHAAQGAGPFISVELPKLGAILKTGDRAALLVSALSALDAVAPADGEVIEINQDAIDEPSQINADPQGKGWLYRLRVDDAAALNGLMDEQAYRQFVAA